MLKKLLFVFCLSCISVSNIYAQDDLLDELDDDSVDSSYELPAFKALKIGNLQSTKIANKGDLYFIVSHRFGALNNGIETFFGLDEANTKIQFLYGITDGFQLSVSRESFNRTFAGAAKFRIARQSKKFPFNLVGYGTVNVNTLIDETVFPELESSDRYSYATQLLISRRFSDKFSFEIAPSYVRENLQNLNVVPEANHNQFAVGFGGRYKLSKRVSLNAEYIYNTSRPDNSPFEDGFAFGFDIETGGHVFQLLFTNAQSTNTPNFINNAQGDLLFGFNIVRVF